jgi:hypothetical protein
MEEFFWFFLGAMLHSIIFRLNVIHEKAKFIGQIKIIAFILIGRAFEAMVFAHALKYKLLNSDPTMDKERIKLFKNSDDEFLENWKKDTVVMLNSAVPPVYKDFLGLNSWDEMMEILDEFYKKKAYQREERESGRGE